MFEKLKQLFINISYLCNNDLAKVENKQYIKLYELKPRDFNDLVEQLKIREKFGEIRNIDAIKSFPKKEFRARFNYDLL